LQTSKEELESMNEELNTVNSEQEARMEALGRANDDMKNLLNSIRVATIFLDEDLKVKRYTEEAQSAFRLIESDIGRPLSDLSTDLEYDHLSEDCRHVLQTLESREAEIRDQEGRWYRLRVMPYRTSENVIDGVVITLSDITRAKEAEITATASRDFFSSIVETVRHPLLVLDPDLRVSEVNQAFCSAFGVERSDARGTRVYDLAQGQWDIPELRELLESILPEKTVMRDYRMEADFPGSGRRDLLLNARKLDQAESRPALILLAIEDATGKDAP
jgi:PAS domain S-box-containing protein